MNGIKRGLKRRLWWLSEGKQEWDRLKYLFSRPTNLIKPQHNAPNVILLSVDSMAARHLSCYRYHRRTSPCIDALAGSGVLFENVITQANWTKPALASMLTSLYPSVHKTDSKGEAGDRINVQDKRQANVLDDRFRTMAQEFHDAGFRTAGFSNGGYAHSFFGFGRGFDLYDDYAGGAKSCLFRLLRWLVQDQGAPFFAFIHFWDTHFPYADRPPYNRLFVKERADIVLDSVSRVAINSGSRVPSRDEIEFLEALFDGSINYVDHQIGAFVHELHRLGLADHTIIGVTADHGEAFMEHGIIEHTEVLYNEVIRVPLILAGPGLPTGKRISSQVRSIDIMPTLLHLCGLQPTCEIQGTSLVSWIAGACVSDLMAASETERRGRIKALCDGQHKLIRKEAENRQELYDLVRDPTESNDISSSNLGLLAALEAQFAAWEEELRECAERYWQKEGVNQGEELSPEVVARLRDLGYLE
jgi:choline-sulfatase